MHSSLRIHNGRRPEIADFLEVLPGRPDQVAEAENAACPLSHVAVLLADNTDEVSTAENHREADLLELDAHRLHLLMRLLVGQFGGRSGRAYRTELGLAARGQLLPEPLDRERIDYQDERPGLVEIPQLLGAV